MNYEEMSNKIFAYQMFELLIKKGNLNEKDLTLLTNLEECKRRFDCTKFPILSEVNSVGELKAGKCYDEIGRQRYYKDKVIVGDRAFVITNHWYGRNKSMKDNRTPFMRWVLQKVN